MRLLWSLPKAAPVLLRHVSGYLELLGYDLAQAEREIVASIVIFALILLCLFFVVLMGCVSVLALTWDTPHRLPAIAWMGGGFLAAAVALLVHLKKRRERSPFFDSVRREWREDREILERVLSEEEYR